MRQFLFCLGIAGLTALVGLTGCGMDGPHLGKPTAWPNAGDTVQPELREAPQWTAGKAGALVVRLVSRATPETAPRGLVFFDTTNPVAVITFYAEDRKLESVTATLSDRC